MQKLIVLACIIFFATATSTGFTGIIAEHEQATLGSSLDTLIQMNQGYDSQVNEIGELLLDLQALLDEQQKQHDQKIESARVNFENTEAELNNQLERAKKALKDSQDESDSLSTETTEKQGQLSSLQTAQEEAQASLEKAEGDLSEEETAFENFAGGFDDAIIACEEAVSLLQSLLVQQGAVQVLAQTNSKSASVLFVQLSQNFSGVKEILEERVSKVGEMAMIQPIIDVLAEMGTQGSFNPEQVTQIIELINTLLLRLREGLASRRQSFEVTKKDLGTLIDTLEDQEGQLSTQIQILDGRLTAISERQEQLAGLITEAEDIVSALELQISGAIADMEEEERIYSSETATRKANLALLDRLIEHFNSEVVGAVGNVSA